jgi:protein-disulfide isomerase
LPRPGARGSVGAPPNPAARPPDHVPIHGLFARRRAGAEREPSRQISKEKKRSKEFVMNKGTAIVGFLLSFIAGMFLMWGIDKRSGGDISAESAAATGNFDHSAASVPVTAKDPIWGKAGAPVTIVEISDFECPFCSRVNPTMKQIKETYGPDKVRLVWKHNPLPFHKAARPAHEAAATVMGLAGSDAFWKFHDQAFANQKDLTPENFEKWAVAAGVDLAKFKEAFAAKTYASKVDDDMKVAKSIGASGTPAFRINGVTVSGAQPFDKFKEVIDAQLEEAKKLVASGTKPMDVYTQLTNKNQNAQPSQDSPKKPAAADEEEDKSVWKVPVLADDPTEGPKDALVTIIEFSEYQCPFCKRVNETLDKVTETYKDDVRIVWKDNPLPFHPRAKPAAIFARHVYKTKGEKAFWAVHHALFESQPKLEDADLQAIAEKNGVPWDAVKSAIDSNKYMDKIDQSVEVASDFQARGTPHFFINGVRLSGAQPFDNFKKVIDEQLAKAKALVAKGVPRAKVYEEVTKDGKEPPPPEKKEVAAPGPSNAFKGGANAKVVMQVFSEFQCPFCKKVEPTLAELEKEYGNKLKIVWRHMPLPFHTDAPLASEAAQEAFAQKGNAGFWKFHDKTFEGQEQGIKRERLEAIAQEIGLDMDKFKAALDSHKHKATVDADMKVGSDGGVSGTPAFVINGYFISGAQPAPAFKKVINRALRESGG